MMQDNINFDTLRGSKTIHEKYQYRANSMLDRKSEPAFLHQQKRQSMPLSQLYIDPAEQQFEEKKAEW